MVVPSTFWLECLLRLDGNRNFPLCILTCFRLYCPASINLSSFNSLVQAMIAGFCVGSMNRNHLIYSLGSDIIVEPNITWNEFGANIMVQMLSVALGEYEWNLCIWKFFHSKRFLVCFEGNAVIDIFHRFNRTRMQNVQCERKLMILRKTQAQ